MVVQYHHRIFIFFKFPKQVCTNFFLFFTFFFFRKINTIIKKQKVISSSSGGDLFSDIVGMNNIITLSDFIKFLSDFKICPQILHKDLVKNIFETTTRKKKKKKTKILKKIDQVVHPQTKIKTVTHVQSQHRRRHRDRTGLSWVRLGKISWT